MRAFENINFERGREDIDLFDFNSRCHDTIRSITTRTLNSLNFSIRSAR